MWIALTDGKLPSWDAPSLKNRKPGRQRKYSNHAIETAVTVSMVFGLASRQTEGFLRSLLGLLNLDNDVPDHTTISRRKAKLAKVSFIQDRPKTLESQRLEARIGCKILNTMTALGMPCGEMVG